MKESIKQSLMLECERRMKDAILNNIVREVDAIRGYLIDPVEGDFINDEIKHIEELCAELRIACYGEPAAQEEDPPADEDEEGERGEDGEEELEPDDDEDDPEEGEHY